MHPKSPFLKKNNKYLIHINPEDDCIFNFNVKIISNRKMRESFITIKNNIENISLQLYNLEITKQVCLKGTVDCETDPVEISKISQSLNDVKNSLCREAHRIIDKYSLTTCSTKSK